MILSVKNRFVCICLLLGLTLPATGQVYTTSKAKVHSVSASGIEYDDWDNSSSRRNVYGPSSSFYSTSHHVSAGPSYSVSVPSISVKTSFTTSASSIKGGITLQDQVSSLTTDGGLGGPHKTIGPPSKEDGGAPIGDIPWIVMALAAIVFVIVKKRKFE